MNEDKPDSLTASVARLHRAGDVNSQSNQKMAKAIYALLQWMRQNVPHEFWNKLPDGCTLFPSGEFNNLRNYPGMLHFLQEEGFFNFSHNNLADPRNFDLRSMTTFAKLIATGWLDRVSEMLEESSLLLDSASDSMGAFLGAK